MDILNYIIEISEGIKFINDTGIVHRLLKPKKIFLTKDNHIKLSDFGFASILEEQYKSDKIEKENIIYYSPELLNEEMSDFTSDAWNIGIILYYLTQLKHPFDDNNIDKIMENISNGKYHSLTNNNYSNDLLQLIENLLLVNPEERYEIIDIINECELIKLKNILGPNSK
jgi:NIMA (never in mitosis gene a)-related kinase